MQICNPFLINEWDRKDYVVFIIAIQLAMLGAIGISAIDSSFVILRQILGFLYLSYIPGVMILRIMDIRRIGSTMTLLFATGLSISLVMLIGLLINILYPSLGINRPLSSTSVIPSVVLTMVVLSVVSSLTLKRENNNAVTPRIYIPLNVILVFAVIVCIAISGPLILTDYSNNIFQMCLLLMIAIMPFVFTKIVPEKYLPVLVAAISLSLLYHTSLVSGYLWGSDIQEEYYYAHLALINMYWNYSISSNVSAMLSIVVLAPIYSIFLKMNLILVFKVIYTLIYALVPVGLFNIFVRLTGSKRAFYAVYYFMSVFTFFNDMPVLARQEIAELFFVLIIALLFLKVTKKELLLVIFGASLIVSHYGLTYIVLLGIIVSWLIVNSSALGIEFKRKARDFVLINNLYITLFAVLLITWFMYIGNSSILRAGVGLAMSISSSLSETFSSQANQAVAIIGNKFAIAATAEKYLYLASQVMVAIGLYDIIKNKVRGRNNREFYLLSISFFILAAAGVALPFFGSAMSSERLYHMTLFLLSPLFVLGFSICVRPLYAIIPKVRHSIFHMLMAIFLSVFFLLNSSFISQIFSESQVGRFAVDSGVDFSRYNECELSAGQWISETCNSQYIIVADVYRSYLLYGLMYNPLIKQIVPNGDISAGSYIFLGTYNLESSNVLASDSKYYHEKSILTRDSSRIYDNGGANLLFVAQPSSLR
jgi:uncharacterized membrane protein